jgi:hypothetical protein
MANYDPQFLFFTSKGGGDDKVKGLLVFNQDSAVSKVPNTSGPLTCTNETKVNLLHVSSVDGDQIEQYLDLGLDYIWKTMHCNQIRAQLLHFMQVNPKTGVEKPMSFDVLKTLFKQRNFKWKQLKHETETDTRTEVLESKNL